MLNKLTGFFISIASWKTFAVALIVYLIFGFGIMPYGKQKFKEITGKQVEILDLHFSYTPLQVHEWLDEYGPDGRKMAASFEAIADGLYPMAYTFLFAIIMALLVKGLATYNIKADYIILVPIVNMLFDYAENTGIITMLISYPDFSDKTVMITSFFTSLKWSCLGVQAFIIFSSLGILGYRRLSR